MDIPDNQWLDNLLIQMLPDMDDKYTPITRKEAKQIILAHIAKQVRLGKVEAERYGRLNEHHIISRIFDNDELGQLKPETYRRLKDRIKVLEDGEPLTESVK